MDFISRVPKDDTLEMVINWNISCTYSGIAIIPFLEGYIAVKKEIISFRMDITFWLAILLLIATMLSRHVGRILPLNLNLPAGSEGSSEISGLPGSD